MSTRARPELTGDEERGVREVDVLDELPGLPVGLDKVAKGQETPPNSNILPVNNFRRGQDVNLGRLTAQPMNALAGICTRILNQSKCFIVSCRNIQ